VFVRLDHVAGVIVTQIAAAPERLQDAELLAQIFNCLTEMPATDETRNRLA
jgi:hypothetical protein